MALVLTTGLMFGFTLYRANVMLRYDGFSRIQCLKMNARGMQWLLGKNGKLRKMKPQYHDWFKPDFTLANTRFIAQYDVWLETLAETR